MYSAFSSAAEPRTGWKVLLLNTNAKRIQYKLEKEMPRNARRRSPRNLTAHRAHTWLGPTATLFFGGRELRTHDGAAWSKQVLEALPSLYISGPWKCTITPAGNVQHQAGGGGGQWPVSMRSFKTAMSKQSMLQAKALLRGNELGLGAGHRTYCPVASASGCVVVWPSPTKKNVQHRYPSVHFGNRTQNM